MWRLAGRLPRPESLVRLALVAFVLVWLFGPDALQSAVPVWVAFAIALGLELHFFAGALRPGAARRPDRGPQAIDRERYGYEAPSDELVLVRDGGEELWIPYRGETADELTARVEAEREREAPEPLPAVEEHRDRGRPVRRFLGGLGVIGALVLVLWVADARTGWGALDGDAQAAAEARFSAEASRVAQKPVTIRCDDSGSRVGFVQHADGVAAVGGNLAFLAPDRCLDLYRLAFDGEVKGSRTGRALAVLAHEAWHLRGVVDEGTTECYAVQTGVDLGRRLGLSAERARQLMRQQLTENALHRGGSLEYVVPRDCRDGDRLDLHPESATFP